MTTTLLKLIGCVLMTLDHIGEFFPDTPIWFRWLGRIVFPMFTYCTVESIEKTSNIKKYLLRMYIASASMGVIIFIFNILNVDKIGRVYNNIFSTLFSIIVLVTLLNYKKTNLKKWRKYVILYCMWQIITFIFMYNLENDSYLYLMEGFLGNIFLNEGTFICVIFGVLLYYVKNNKIKLSIYFISFCAIYSAIIISDIIPRILCRLEYYQFNTLYLVLSFLLGALGFSTIGIGYNSIVYYDYQWMIIGALPLILMYNGKKGKGYKYFFYVYYPLHILALCLIKIVFMLV